MKLIAESGGAVLDIEIARSETSCTAHIDGREYQLDASQPEPGVYLLKDGLRVFEIVVEPEPLASGSFIVKLMGREVVVRISDPKKLRGSAAADGHGDGLVEIKTAMPGKVVRIVAEAGKSVAKGDGVIVVEAMKMQNELKAPRTGTVKEIRVEAGDTVAAGQTLALIE